MVIEVFGIPAPQGSKKPVGRDGKGRVLLVESSKKVKPWREAVKCAATEAFGQRPRPIITGPVRMEVTFTMPKPKKPKAKVPDRTPDLSKLVRSTEDALTEVGAWEDDARIVESFSRKVYVGDARALPSPGAVIRWKSIDAPQLFSQEDL